MRGIVGVAVAACAVLAPVCAQAQDASDVVVMRRQISQPRIDDAPTRRNGEWTTTAWTTQAQQCADRTVLTRSVRCMAAGSEVPEDRCMDAKPSATMDGPADYSGCTVDWVHGEWSAYNPSCAQSASRTRTVQCVRTGGGLQPTVLDNDKCPSGTRPTSTESVSNWEGCSYAWELEAEFVSDRGCNYETRSKQYTCRRSDPARTSVAESLCGAMPQTEFTTATNTCSTRTCSNPQTNMSMTGEFRSGMSAIAPRPANAQEAIATLKRICENSGGDFTHCSGEVNGSYFIISGTTPTGRNSITNRTNSYYLTCN